jgi:hypothetical protein
MSAIDHVEHIVRSNVGGPNLLENVKNPTVALCGVICRREVTGDTKKMPLRSAAL